MGSDTTAGAGDCRAELCTHQVEMLVPADEPAAGGELRVGDLPGEVEGGEFLDECTVLCPARWDCAWSRRQRSRSQSAHSVEERELVILLFRGPHGPDDGRRGAQRFRRPRRVPARGERIAAHQTAPSRVDASRSRGLVAIRPLRDNGLRLARGFTRTKCVAIRDALGPRPAAPAQPGGEGDSGPALTSGPTGRSVV